MSSWCVITSACYLHCAPMLHPLQALSNQFVLTHEEIVHRRRLLVSAAGRGGEEGGVDMDSSTVGLTPRNSLTMQASPDKHARGSKLDRGSAKQAGKKDSAKKDDKGGRKEDKPRQSEQLRTTCTWASLINAYHSFLHTYAYLRIAHMYIHAYIHGMQSLCNSLPCPLQTALKPRSSPRAKTARLAKSCPLSPHLALRPR